MQRHLIETFKHYGYIFPRNFNTIILNEEKIWIFDRSGF